MTDLEPQGSSSAPNRPEGGIISIHVAPGFNGATVLYFRSLSVAQLPRGLMIVSGHRCQHAEPGSLRFQRSICPKPMLHQAPEVVTFPAEAHGAGGG